jgi:hypothetical protein
LAYPSFLFHEHGKQRAVVRHGLALWSDQRRELIAARGFFDVPELEVAFNELLIRDQVVTMDIVDMQVLWQLRETQCGRRNASASSVRS